MLWLICLHSRSFFNIKDPNKAFTDTNRAFLSSALFHESLKKGFICFWWDYLFCLLVFKSWQARFSLISWPFVKHKTWDEATWRRKQSINLEWVVWVFKSKSRLSPSSAEFSNDLFSRRETAGSKWMLDPVMNVGISLPKQQVSIQLSGNSKYAFVSQIQYWSLGNAQWSGFGQNRMIWWCHNVLMPHPRMVQCQAANFLVSQWLGRSKAD